MNGVPDEPADDRRELALDLPANHGAVKVARRVVRHFARLNGVGPEGLDALQLVSTELLANAVDHGGGGGELGAGGGGAPAHAGGRMRMALAVGADGWTFRVSDEGGGDPGDVQALITPDGPPDLEDERGRGFFLVAQLVDRLAVEKSADGRGLTFVAERSEGR